MYLGISQLIPVLYHVLHGDIVVTQLLRLLARGRYKYPLKRRSSQQCGPLRCYLEHRRHTGSGGIHQLLSIPGLVMKTGTHTQVPHD